MKNWKLWIALIAAIVLGSLISSSVKAVEPLRIAYHDQDRYVEVKGEPHHVRMFVEAWWTATWNGSMEWKTYDEEVLRRQVKQSFESAEKGSVYLYHNKKRPEEQHTKALQIAIDEYLSTAVLIARE